MFEGYNLEYWSPSYFTKQITFTYPVQMGFEHPQEWRLHSVSRQPVPRIKHLCSKTKNPPCLNRISHISVCAHTHCVSVTLWAGVLYTRRSQN